MFIVFYAVPILVIALELEEDLLLYLLKLLFNDIFEIDHAHAHFILISFTSIEVVLKNCIES